ncbi:MAG: DUF2085 domain-containing protein [Chloroherpetonaceae bacterium]
MFSMHSDTIQRLLPRFAVAGVMLILLAFAILAPYEASHGNPTNYTNYYALFRGICHQKAHRCFELFGFPMAVCARCTLIYFGIAIGALFLPTFNSDNRRRYLILLGISSGLVGIDVVCGYLHLYHNVFATRIVTGFLVGLPLGAMSTAAVQDLLKKKPTSSTAI